MQNNCCVITSDWPTPGTPRSHRANWSPADKARMQWRLHPPTRHAVSELAVIIEVNSKHTWLSPKPIRASRTTSWKSVFLSRLVLCRKMTTAALKQGDKDKRSIRLMCAHTRKCFTWRTWFTFRAREFSETSFCSLPAALSCPRHQTLLKLRNAPLQPLHLGRHRGLFMLSPGKRVC